MEHQRLLLLVQERIDDGSTIAPRQSVPKDQVIHACSTATSPPPSASSTPQIGDHPQQQEPSSQTTTVHADACSATASTSSTASFLVVKFLQTVHHPASTIMSLRFASTYHHPWSLSTTRQTSQLPVTAFPSPTDSTVVDSSSTSSCESSGPGDECVDPSCMTVSSSSLSSSSSTTICTKSRRSCLKTTTTTPFPLPIKLRQQPKTRNVHFDPQVHVMANDTATDDGCDMITEMTEEEAQQQLDEWRSQWVTLDDLNARRYADVYDVEFDVHLQRYLRTSDAAYLEVVNDTHQPFMDHLNLTHHIHQHHANNSNNRSSNSSSAALQRKISQCQKNGIQQLIMYGIDHGYRAMEYYSWHGQQRSKTRRLAVKSIVAKSRLLAAMSAPSLSSSYSGGASFNNNNNNNNVVDRMIAMTSASCQSSSSSLLSFVSSTVHGGFGSDLHQLRKHSLRLSRRSTQWAQFMGAMDAYAAMDVYATIPSELLVVSCSSSEAAPVLPNQPPSPQSVITTPSMTETSTDVSSTSTERSSSTSWAGRIHWSFPLRHLWLVPPVQ